MSNLNQDDFLWEKLCVGAVHVALFAAQVASDPRRASDAYMQSLGGAMAHAVRAGAWL